MTRRLPPRATDILLNTVAAVFVLDIDNYAFEYFVMDLNKSILTSLPPLGVLMTFIKRVGIMGLLLRLL